MHHNERYPLDFDKQRELEDLAVGMGVRRFRQRLLKAEKKGDPTRVGAGRKLLTEAVKQVSTVMEEWLSTPRRGARHTAMKWLNEIGHDKAAYIGCRTVLFTVSGMPILVSAAAREIAGHIIDQIRVDRFRELAPALFEYREKQLMTSNRAWAARFLAGGSKTAVCSDCYEAGHRAGKACPHLKMEDLALINQDERLRIGLKVIDIVLESFPGWLERKTEIIPKFKQGVETEVTLSLTPKAQIWIDAKNEILSELFPVALPMVVPPLPWTPGATGGYRFALLGKYPLVRSTPRHRAMVAQVGHIPIYDALNRIQETPWKVNREVLAVVEEITERGGGRAGIPRMDTTEEPVRDSILETGDPEEEQFQVSLRKYKEAKTRWYATEGERKGSVMSFLQMRSIIDVVKDEQAFWLPWTLDFRGRAYPVTPYLQPQGSDLARGLLKFADSEPITESGITWLKRHTANCLDEWEGTKINTLTLPEREALVDSIMPDLLAVGRDPFENKWWMEMEEPFQLLACCFEWVGVDRDGPEYECSLPVSIDGSCNGLQHFSALLKDPVGAKSVNVLPNARPQDVYSQVTQTVLDRLEEKAGEDEIAQRWLASGMVNRKAMKRPTMTFSYGSGRFGFVEQLLHHYKTKVPNFRDEVEMVYFTVQNEETHEDISILARCCTYLAKIIEQAISEVVVGAFDARQWLQASAQTLARVGIPVAWTVPETGFPVIQDAVSYWELDSKQIETSLGGVRFQPKVHNAGRKVNSLRQSNGVAPNYIHSLDASAMMMTVLMASSHGVCHFAMVHDSFGTLPSQMETLNRATRESFHALYTNHKPLEDLYHELIDLYLTHGGEIGDFPEPPEEGDLDLGAVLASDYFFA